MKKLMFVLIALALLAVPSAAIADPSTCTTIQDGVLTYAPGRYLESQPLMVGYDPFGYNYQAHMFKGSYANAYLNRDGFPPYGGDDAAYAQRLAAEGFSTNPYSNWYWPYRDVELVMKWNDAWLSNKDCDEDGSLDRYYGFDSYIGSGAWETNHMWGTYEQDGMTCEWDYFTKIVAAPADAYKDGGIWYAADETEIGPVIWGDFATIQQVENDPCAAIEGLQYLSPDHPGFGGG